MSTRLEVQRGFTLIETLVALAIIAIALAAALRAMTANIDAVTDMKTRTQAAWVASNVINQMVAQQVFPDMGAREGRVTQGHSEFIWRQEVTVTPNYSFRRVEVKVFLPGALEHAVARQVSYVARK